MSIVGGKAIASGGYGCVFHPALKCKDENDRYDGVSKLLSKKHAKEEMKEAEKILPVLQKHVKDYKNYVLLPEKLCEIDSLTTADKKCVKEKCNQFKITNLSNYRILNMPFGGPDFRQFFVAKQLSGETFVTINNSMIDMLENAIVPFNRAGLIHGDLKSQNILVTPDNLKCKIIDWGLAMITKDNSKYHTETVIKNDLEWKPIQFNIPTSSILFSDFMQVQIQMYLSNLDQRPIDIEELKHFLLEQYDKFKDLNGNGHYKILKYYTSLMVKRSGTIIEPAEEIIFEYIAKVVAGFEMRNRNQFSLGVDVHKYFSEVFRYNCDVWGWLVSYFDIMKMSSSEIKTRQGVSPHDFQSTLSKMIFKFLFKYPTQRIPVHEVCKEFRALNSFFDAPVQVMSDEEIKSTLDEIVKTTATLKDDTPQSRTVTEKRPSPIDSELIDAIEMKNNVRVLELLDNGGHVNKTYNENGDTPLHVASYSGNVDMITALLDRGADINAATNYDLWTPLHISLESYQKESALLLINKGANVHARDRDGLTPLHYACNVGFIEVVMVLIDKGVDVNASDYKGNTPLHYVCKSGHIELVKKLVEGGADIHVKNKMGDTAFQNCIPTSDKNHKMSLKYNIREKGDAKTYIYINPYPNLDDIELILKDYDKLVAYNNNYVGDSIADYVDSLMNKSGFLCKGLNPTYVLKSLANADAIVVVGSSMNVLPNGNMFGFASINFDKIHNSIYIDVICSHAGIKGAGDFLIKEIESICRKLSMEKITLQSVKSAIPFYLKYGFTKKKKSCNDMCLMTYHIEKKHSGGRKKKTNKQKKNTNKQKKKTNKQKKTKKNRKLRKTRKVKKI
jgi:ankyrin repeat protein